VPRSVKPRRSYESPRRTEQARATRVAVLDAARDLFVGRGFVATTVQAIADRAGVSPETVYAAFRSKRALLSAVLSERLLLGRTAELRPEETAWVQRMRESPTHGAAHILTRNGRIILERIGPI
jgi:AcrR family transcriptional regulator